MVLLITSFLPHLHPLQSLFLRWHWGFPNREQDSNIPLPRLSQFLEPFSWPLSHRFIDLLELRISVLSLLHLLPCSEQVLQHHAPLH